ncbi:MAG: hypothetical protein R6X25_00705 [Candidatus Krumholzibacteriia bacterium]
MKKMLVVLIVALMASAAAAQDTGTDSFGLYFDAELTQNEIVIGTGTPFNMYLAIAGPTVRSAAALEVQLQLVPSDAFLFVNATEWIGTEGIDILGDAFGFIVGFGTPIEAADGYIYLGYMNLTSFAPAVQFLAGPVEQASVPNEAVYVDGDDFGNLVIMEFATDENGMGRGPDGWLLPGYELAAVNADAATSAENATWTQVKGLFR